MSYQVSARKWRPQTFHEVVGQRHVARTLKNALISDRVAHAYLFSGMRGIGKTTMARILAKALNCLHPLDSEPCNECAICLEITRGACPDVIEIDGASNTGVDDVRSLREKVQYAPSRGKYKIYIVDEVHMLSQSAFNAFLKTLEEPPPQTVFIFATTEPHKIPETIQSRCQCFEFKGLTKSEILSQLNHVAEKDGITFKGRGLELIAQRAEGGMRDALVSFDQVVSYAGKEIDEQNVRDILGLVNAFVILSISQSIIEGNIAALISQIAEMNNNGTDLILFCRDFFEYLRNLTVFKMVKDSPEKFVDVSQEELNTLKKQSKQIDANALQVMFQILLKTEYEMRYSPVPVLVLEMGLIKMTSARSLVGIDDLLKKINEIDNSEILPPTKPAIKIEQKMTQTQLLHPESGSGTEIKKPVNITPPQPSSPVLSSPVELSSQTNINEIWEKIKIKVGEKKPRLGGILEHVFLNKMDNNTVIIEFQEGITSEFYKKGIEAETDLLKETIFDITGNRVDIVIKEEKAGEKKGENKTIKRDNEIWKKKIVQEVLDYFPGMVIEG